MAKQNVTQPHSPKQTKSERFEIRLTPAQKERLEQAALLENCKMTTFVTQAIQSASEDTIKRHQQLVLSAEASKRFVEALLSPPAPNEALKSAFTKYKDSIQG